MIACERTPESDQVACAIEQRMASRTTEEWIPALREAGVPAEAVSEAPVDFALHEPQLLRSGAVAEYTHPQYGMLRVVGSHIRFSNADAKASAPLSKLPPPLLGQHTRDILAEIGYAAPEIERLETDGIVKTTPAG
jgi:crotonobetainyl-CoA:carnitine CoA-transferase CaiB-like acyl-CoA transferase